MVGLSAGAPRHPRLLACLLGLLAALVLGASPAAAFTHIRSTISIPMHDGQALAADLYLPAASGNWPVVLIQTPYNKNLMAGPFLNPLNTDPLFKSPDYAWVILDWRGFYGSAGAAYGGAPTRGQDGYDAVQWIATQSWCSGAVGTWGASALGVAQFLTALQQPPALRACVPIVSPMRTYYEDWWPGGVWHQNINAFRSAYFGLTFYAQHPLYDTFWRLLEGNSGDPAQIDVPMLHIGGWFDHNPVWSLNDMAAIQAGGGPGARGKQWMLLGPWAHGSVGALQQGDLEFPAAEDEAAREALAFFDATLRGLDQGWSARPPYRWFVIGEEAWHGSASWPPPAETTATLHLTLTGGGAGQGLLSETGPTTAGASLAWTADPADPVPTLHGQLLVASDYGTQGPGDLTAAEARADTLEFSTPPLVAPQRFVGRPAARLFVESTAVDVDLALRLTRVLPAGQSLLLSSGVRRASLRGGFTTRTLLTPGQVVEVGVTLGPVAVELQPGERLRLVVAASDYDEYDRNLQDGSSLSSEAGATTTTAQVRLWCDEARPSRLLLPTWPRTAAHGWTWY